MNDLKRLVVTHIATGKVVVDVTVDFESEDRPTVFENLEGEALMAWNNDRGDQTLRYDHPIGTVKETGGYRFEFRKPEPQPDAEGWIVNDGTMPDCERVDLKWQDGSSTHNRKARSFLWKDENLTHYRPAKAEQPKPKGVREVTKTVWIDSDGREYQFEHNAILSELKDKHGFEALHIHTKPNGSSDADAIELFKRILELRK